MNKKQLYLLVSIWIVTIMGFSVLLFKEESFITEKGIEIKEVEQVDVIDEGNKISILSFEKLVQDIVWVDENRIEFTGQKTEGSEKQRYSFDLEEQVMTRADEPLSIELDSTQKLITRVSSELGICTESKNSKGIFLLKNGDLKTITEDATFEDQLKIVISENKEKIGYYDAKSQKIKIYNTVSGKTSNINVFPDAILLKNLDESIIFSPDGGYVVIYYDSLENSNETYFSVYGADSGREYSDKIFGLNPSWSPKELKIAYLYGEGAGIIHSESQNGNYHGKRVGYYDLKSRKSLYVGAIMNKRDILGQIKWARNSDGLGYHTGVFNEETSGWEIDSFTVYNFEDKSFRVESEPFDNGFELESLGDWEFDSKYYITSEQTDNQVDLAMVNLELDAYGKINDIELMSINGKTVVSDILDDKILYKKNKYLYSADLRNYEAIITRDGDILDIVISPDRKKICVISSVNNKTFIDIVNLNKNVTVQ